jgi:uncharacterized membrane protein YesL
MGSNPAINRFFKTFEVIGSFILLNFIMILGSLISLFLLTPVLVFSMFKTLNKLSKKSFDDIVFEYFANIKNNFVKATKIGYPILLAIIVVLYLFLVVNPYIIDLIPIYLYAVILGSQLLLLYMLISVLLIFLMSLAVTETEENLMKKSFLVVFAYPAKTIISFLALFVIPGVVLSVSFYFLFLIIPCGLIGYHIILSKTIDNLY